MMKKGMSPKEVFYDICGIGQEKEQSFSKFVGKDNLFSKAKKILSERQMIMKSKKPYDPLNIKTSELNFAKLYDKKSKEMYKLENTVTPFQRIRQITDNKKKFILNKIKNNQGVKIGICINNVHKTEENKALKFEIVNQFSLQCEKKKSTIYSSFDLKHLKKSKNSNLLFNKCISDRTNTASKASENVELLLNGLTLQQSNTNIKNINDSEKSTEENVVSHFRLSETKLPKIHGKLIHFNTIQSNKISFPIDDTQKTLRISSRASMEFKQQR